MQKFIEFNVAKFLKDAKTWGREKKRLKDKLEDVTEIKGIDSSPIRSGRLHDSVADVAAEREVIQNQISRIELYEQVLSYARDRLTGAQNDVIDVFFFNKESIAKGIHDYSLKYAVCRTDVYKMRREALDEISRVISHRFL